MGSYKKITRFILNFKKKIIYFYIILFLGVQSVGGYLTEGRSNSTTSNVPPPLIKKDYSPY